MWIDVIADPHTGSMANTPDMDLAFELWRAEVDYRYRLEAGEDIPEGERLDRARRLLIYERRTVDHRRSPRPRGPRPGAGQRRAAGTGDRAGSTLA